jgi:hypothetical protein
MSRARKISFRYRNRSDRAESWPDQWGRGDNETRKELGSESMGETGRPQPDKGGKRGIPDMEKVPASETSVDFNETTRRYIPDGCHLHTRRHENLKSHELIDKSLLERSVAKLGAGANHQTKNVFETLDLCS